MTTQDFDNLNKHQGWIATLNNGEMAYETDPVPEERTSWAKLLMRLREETFMKPVYEIIKNRKTQVGVEKTKLEITALRLQRGNLTLHAMPKKAVDGYYQAYEYRLKSLFNPSKGSITSQGIGSVVGELVYIIWINPLGQIYQDVRPLKGSIIHTTLHVPKEDTDK